MARRLTPAQARVKAEEALFLCGCGSCRMCNSAMATLLDTAPIALQPQAPSDGEIAEQEEADELAGDAHDTAGECFDDRMAMYRNEY